MTLQPMLMNKGEGLLVKILVNTTSQEDPIIDGHFEAAPVKKQDPFDRTSRILTGILFVGSIGSFAVVVASVYALTKGAGTPPVLHQQMNSLLWLVGSVSTCSIFSWSLMRSAIKHLLNWNKYEIKKYNESLSRSRASPIGELTEKWSKLHSGLTPAAEEERDALERKDKV